MNLSDWTPALLPALLAIFALWGPGLLVTFALGLTRWRHIAFAPLASAGVMGLGAVVGPFVGIDWGWGLYLATTAGTAALALAFNYLIKQVRQLSADKSEGPKTNQQIPADPKIWPALVGTLISIPFTAGAFIKAIGLPQYPTQTWDGVHHLSAIRWILETGNGSTLNLGAVASNLTEAEATTGWFYPAGFHDLVSLTVTDNVIVATNAVVIVIATVLWPLAAGLFGSIFAPKSYTIPIFTALLAAAFTSFPERPSSYGVLWPIVYSYALVPLLVIAMADWFGRTNQRAMDARITAIAVLGAAGVGIAHPTGIFVTLIAVVMLLIDLIVRLIFRTMRLSKVQVGVLLIAVAALVGGIWVVLQTNAWSTVSSWQRQPIGSFLRESFGVIFESQLPYMGYGDAGIDWLIGGLTLFGAIGALSIARTRWLLFAYGLGSYLFVATAVVDIPGYQLAAPWYFDPVRLGAIVPIFGAPIAALGAWAVLEMVTKIFDGTRAKKVIQPIAAAVAIVGIVVGTNNLGFQTATHQLHINYFFSGKSDLNGLVSPEELEFIQTLPQYVEKGEYITGDPRTGLPLVYALTGLDVTHRHIDGIWDVEELRLGRVFDQILTNPAVCEYLADVNAKYFYTDEIVYWPENGISADYAGFEAARDIVGAFKPVASGGGATLYEITPCPHVQDAN